LSDAELYFDVQKARLMELSDEQILYGRSGTTAYRLSPMAIRDTTLSGAKWKE
jgi:hypothetical protein